MPGTHTILRAWTALRARGCDFQPRYTHLDTHETWSAREGIECKMPERERQNVRHDRGCVERIRHLWCPQWRGSGVTIAPASCPDFAACQMNFANKDKTFHARSTRTEDNARTIRRTRYCRQPPRSYPRRWPHVSDRSLCGTSEYYTYTMYI